MSEDYVPKYGIGWPLVILVAIVVLAITFTAWTGRNAEQANTNRIIEVCAYVEDRTACVKELNESL